MHKFRLSEGVLFAESVSFFEINVRLTQNAAQGADRDFALSRHNCSVDHFACAAHEFHVAASLAGLFKPAASSRRFTSRNGRGLSRPNLNLNGANLRRPSGQRRLKMKLQRFFQVDERFLFSFTLAGDVDFETLGNIPLALSPYRCRKWAFHIDYSFTPPTAAASHSPARSSLLPAE